MFSHSPHSHPHVQPLLLASLLSTLLVACSGTKLKGDTTAPEASAPTSAVTQSAALTTVEPTAAEQAVAASGVIPCQATGNISVALTSQDDEGHAYDEPALLPANCASADSEKLNAAVAKCLALWGAKAPFTAASAYRTIATAAGALADEQITRDAELVVIAAENFPAATKYRLMNPSGWYCIADAPSAKRTVDLHSQAHLADTRVDPAAGAGDNAVYADTTVNKADH